MAETLNLGNGNWAVKKDSLLAYNSENGNYKPLPFDFTRTSSATVVNKVGLIETVGSGEPRIDFKDNTKGALLLEPSRTNLLQYSEDFTSTEWTKNSVSTPIADSISPDGSLNGYSVTNNATGTCILYDNEIGASLSDSTFSVFFKYKDLQYVSLRIDSPTDTALFDILNGSIVDSDATITPRIENYGNGWYRCSITHDSLTAAGNAVIMWNESGVLNNNTMASTSVGYYVYGAQYEVGSCATSYIPTSGSAVTRVADVCNNGGNEQVINSTEGVLYAEIAALSNDGTTRIISLSDGTTANRVNLFFDTTNTLRAFITGVPSIATAAVITDNNKVALKFKSEDISVWLNGTEVATSTSAISLSGLSNLSFNQVGSSNFYGNAKDVRVYDTALTDSELAILTTI
jgi:hypothetical protein